MATIINVGGGAPSNLNVFCQPNQPDGKNGIWLKMDEQIQPKKITFDTSVWAGEQWIVPSPVANMNESRRECWGTLANEEIYIFGGINSGANWISSVEAYNLRTNTYKYVRSMSPLRRYKVACFFYNQKIYLLGGTLYDTDIYEAVTYEPKTDTYQSINNMPKGVYPSYKGVIGENVYIFSDKGTSSTYSAIYNPQTDSYINFSRLPEPRRDGCADAYGDEVFIFGGLNNNTYLSTAIAYNTQTKTYRNVKNVPQTSGDAQCVLAGEEIYIFYSSSTVAYSPQTNTYRVLSSEGARAYAMCICFKDRIYCFGGGSSSSDWQSAGCLSLTPKQYPDDPTAVIYQQPNDHTYVTSLLTNRLIDYLPVYFKDAMLFKNGDITFPAAYYGDGSKWNLFREEQ